MVTLLGEEEECLFTPIGHIFSVCTSRKSTHIWKGTAACSSRCRTGHLSQLGIIHSKKHATSGIVLKSLSAGTRTQNSLFIVAADRPFFKAFFPSGGIIQNNRIDPLFKGPGIRRKMTLRGDTRPLLMKPGCCNKRRRVAGDIVSPSMTALWPPSSPSSMVCLTRVFFGSCCSNRQGVFKR